MFVKQLVFCLLVGYAHSVYIADIEGSIGTTKKIVRLEVSERDFSGFTPPSRFFLIIDGERIQFYHRILDTLTGEYDINLGERGNLNKKSGQEFVCFSKKSLIIIDYLWGDGLFLIKGEIELDTNKIIIFNTKPQLTKINDLNKRNLNEVKSKRVLPVIDYYGKTCALGKTYSFCNRCGKRYVQPNVNRIFGGQSVAQTSWPSFGNLKARAVLFGSVYNLRCGLTLIEKTTVLTAAQCYIKSFDLTSYTVVLGVHSVHQTPSDLKIHQIKSFIIHPNYNAVNGFNDIAVIKLTSEVVYDFMTQPACLPLPSTPEPTSDQRAWIVGFGKTSFYGSYPDYLQNAAVTYYADLNNKCVNYGKLFDPFLQICAGDYATFSVDSCNGDSGGSLYIKDVSLNTYVLTGITSGGFGCGRPGFPGIYTKVQPYLNWIVQNI